MNKIDIYLKYVGVVLYFYLFYFLIKNYFF